MTDNREKVKKVMKESREPEGKNVIQGEPSPSFHGTKKQDKKHKEDAKKHYKFFHHKINTLNAVLCSSCEHHKNIMLNNVCVFDGWLDPVTGKFGKAANWHCRSLNSKCDCKNYSLSWSRKKKKK